MVGIKQISVFLENKPGRLQHITKRLGDNGINIRAFMVAEAGEFGMIRIIVDDPTGAMALLSSKGLVCRSTDVLYVEIPDEVGELARLSAKLAQESVNVDYAYAFLTGKSRAIMVLRLDRQEGGATALSQDYRLLSPEDLRTL